MALSKEEKEAMAAIGHDVVEMPDGGTEDVASDEKAEESVQTPDESQTQSVETAANEEELGSEEEESVPDSEGDESLEDVEQKRRSWQAEATQRKQESEQLRRQNEQLMQTLSQLTGGQGQQSQPEQPSVVKEPQLSDFISPDQYDKFEVGDPMTPSGQAYSKWQRALARHEAKQTIEEDRQAQRQAQQQEVARAQIQQLANDYPEFRDAFGRPDVGKITQFIESVSNDSDPALYSKLYALKNGKASQPESGPAKVGRRQNRVGSASSVSNQGPEKKKVPKVVQDLGELYGGTTLEIPGDAQFDD